MNDPVTCTYSSDEGDFFTGPDIVTCTAPSTHWSPHRGDHVGEGPVCSDHVCRHGETLEEHEKRVAQTPSSWMAL